MLPLELPAILMLVSFFILLLAGIPVAMTLAVSGFVFGSLGFGTLLFNLLPHRLFGVVTNSTLLANMAPIFVTLATWLFLRKSVSRVFLAGLALSIVGVVVLNARALSVGGDGHDSHFRGDIVALVAAAFYAGYFIFLARARNVFSTPVVMVWSTIAAAICVLPMAIVFEPAFAPHTLAGWAVLAGLGWLVHAGGQGLIAFSLAWLPATFSSLTLLIQPVVAAVLAWTLLTEPLGPSQVLGGCIVIAGILLARRTA